MGTDPVKGPGGGVCVAWVAVGEDGGVWSLWGLV